MAKSIESQRTQWEEEGYLVFDNAIQGEDLARLQRAFDYWAEQCKSHWLKQVEAGEAVSTFYDIPGVFEKDEIFVDLVDHPSYYPYLKAFTDGEVILLAPQARKLSRHGQLLTPVGTPTYPTAIHCISKFRSM